jgi:hypothetical protein
MEMNLYLDMNGSYETTLDCIKRFWNTKPVKKAKYANIYIVNIQNRNMGCMRMVRLKDGEIRVQTDVEILYNYRGYAKRFQHHYNEYNGIERLFRAIDSSAFNYELIKFVDYCRGIEITDEILTEEIEYAAHIDRMNAELYEDMELHKLPLEYEIYA